MTAYSETEMLRESLFATIVRCVSSLAVNFSHGAAQSALIREHAMQGKHGTTALETSLLVRRDVVHVSTRLSIVLMPIQPLHDEQKVVRRLNIAFISTLPSQETKLDGCGCNAALVIRLFGHPIVVVSERL